MPLRTLLSLLPFIVLLNGCGETRYMEPGTRIEKPPTGKSLVNVHRPSTAYGSGEDLIVWDRDSIIGNTHGKDMFQYVCDPGPHIFHAKQLNVSVLQATLAPDKIYDLVCDCGPNFIPFQPSYRLWLNGVGPDRASKVPLWMQSESTLVLSDKSKAERQKYQDKHLEDVHRYVADFTTGSKSDKSGIIREEEGR